MLKITARDHFGSLEAIAQALGITKSAVSQWSELVPQGSAYKLQFITGGTLQVQQHLYPKARRVKPLSNQVCTLPHIAAQKIGAPR